MESVAAAAVAEELFVVVDFVFAADVAVAAVECAAELTVATNIKIKLILRAFQNDLIRQ